MDKNDQTNRRSGANKWFVFVSSFLVLMTMTGFFFSMGKMFVIIMEIFHTTRAEAASIQSVAMGVDHSIGLGESLLFISATTAVGYNFRGKYSTIAMSALSAGAGLGGMMYPYLIDYLKKYSDMYGIRGTLLIIGAIVLNSTAAALLRETRTELRTKSPCKINVNNYCNRVNDINGNINRGFTSSDKVETYSQKKTTEKHMLNEIKKITNNIIIGGRNLRTGNSLGIQSLRHTNELCGTTTKSNNTRLMSQTSVKQSLLHLMKNKPFVVFVLVQSLVSPAIGIFITFIVDIFRDKSFSNSSASLALLLLNICNALGRLSPGVLSLLPCFTTLSVPVIASIIGTLSLIAIVFTKTLPFGLMICVANGLSLGMVRSAFTVITANLVGIDHMSIGMGCAFTLNGIVSIIVGPLCGYIRDRTGSYTLVFVGAGTATTVGCFLFLLGQTKKIVCLGQPSQKS